MKCKLHQFWKRRSYWLPLNTNGDTDLVNVSVLNFKEYLLAIILIDVKHMRYNQ